jgi:beta-carotene ketolase (CrtO type)
MVVTIGGKEAYMNTKERYDVVIIGGGPNGLGMAAYLAKSGVKVCVVEARLEVGGGCETIEPIPGFRIEPHAAYNYAGASPAWEQLELWKYGLRIVPCEVWGTAVSSDCQRVTAASNQNKEVVREAMKMWGDDVAAQTEAIYSILESPECTEFLRSIYWTPPLPEGYSRDPKDLPWIKTIKKLPLLGQAYDDSWLDMSTFDISDLLCSEESQKVGICVAAYQSGPNHLSKGMGIVGTAITFLIMHACGVFLGGMHSYAHAVTRCALAHGATFLTNSKVEEIIIENGEAKGVRLADTAPAANKVIWADKAVISNAHVKQTFLDLIDPKNLDRAFLQKVRDINLNGGSLFKLDMVVKELPRFKGKAGEFMDKHPSLGCVFPIDSMDVLNRHRNAADAECRFPSFDKDEIIMFTVRSSVYDPTRCPPGYHILYNFFPVPVPEYFVDGKENYNKHKEEMVDAMLSMYRKYCTNMGDDNIVAKFALSPLDSSFRNTGFVGGNWEGIRPCEDQWGENRPLPECARYRTPIHKLYLCNQTSHPGGLALMAVPYNLMHILIEDLDLKPGGWWYPSPYYVSDREVKSGEV